MVHSLQKQQIEVNAMKRLLITVVLFVSGLAISKGAIEVTFPVGYSFCAPPLETAAGSLICDAELLLPALQPGDAILTWNGAGFNFDVYLGPGAWFDGITFAPIPIPTVPMGSGFVYLNGSAAAEVNVYPGFALGGAAGGAARILPNGFSLIGSFIPNPPYPLPPALPPAVPVPVAGLLAVSAESVFFSLPLTSGDEIFKWNGAGYDTALYDSPGTWYDAVTFAPIAAPMINPTEGFFYLNNSGAAKLWTQPP
jgi:hypothetical protein